MRKLIFPVLFFIIAGCSKEINYEPINSGSVENTEVASDTYLPLTNGTHWKYENKTGSKEERSRVKVLDLKKSYNGKNYTYIKTTRDNNSDTIYYNQTQHSYYIYTRESTEDAGDVKLEILFLKDDVAAGNSWTGNAGSADGVSLNYFGKILEKNITMNIAGTKYNNVIHSYVEIRKRVLFFYITVFKQDYYVAKNIGIIKNISTQVLPTASTTTTTITNYSIE